MSKYLSIVSLMFVLIISCSDSTKIVDPPPVENLVYQFSDYIHFDTTNDYVVASSQNGSGYFPELYVYWEEVIGEPFTDLNGNGVYDAGIDIFIRSVGADNMDLNHNGVHDGPEDLWTSGVPFDDINGDGLYQRGNNGIYSNNYTLGRPYYDFNSNGIWDSVTTYDCAVVECKLSRQDSLDIFSFKMLDSSFIFNSDSNLTYYVPYSYFSYMPFNLLKTNSNSFGFQINYFEVQDVFELDSDKNFISADSAYVDIINLHYIDSLYKEVILEAELEYKDSVYTDLLHVRYSGYDRYYSNRDVSLEFYFSKDNGLIALIDNNFINRENISRTRINFFIDKIDSIPILLTK